ncbi:MAG: phosphoenolpyruvate--protein phosphotransferase [Gemmatimonadetes bacterium]|nr:phosphoenolpyruvate--protein phosphotransferase [Gemmatimonadota bacterium]
MRSRSVVLQGHSISPGLAVGKVEIRIEDLTTVPVYSLATDAAVDHEIELLAGAMKDADAEAEAEVVWARGCLPDSEAEIFEAQRAILRDPSLTQWVEDKIRKDRVNAASAVHSRFDEFRAILQESSSEIIRNRIQDVSDAERLILSHLLGVAHQRKDYDTSSGPLILVTDDPPPSLLARVDPDQVVGVACQQGAGMGHVAVLARALNLPAVIQVEGLLAATRDGDVLVIDGESGTVSVNPTEAELEELRPRQRRQRLMQPSQAQASRRDRVAADGERIYLSGNATSQREVDASAQVDADGIGLYRTEFLYLSQTRLPTESQLVGAYSEAAGSFVNDPVDIRLLDLGSDKHLPGAPQPAERNPALGLRSLRFLFANPGILHTQLRAVLQAAADGPVRLLLPMVTGPEDIRRVRAALAECHEELRREGLRHEPDLPVGAMIENPAGVFLVEEILAEADFLSVGTNDLTMYLLAVDREASHLAPYYDPYHPAIVRTVHGLVRSAEAAGKTLSLCGEIAGDPTLTGLLLGLGVRRFSMNPQWISPVGQVVHGIDLASWRAVAEETVEMDTAEAIRKRVRAHQLSL